MPRMLKYQEIEGWLRQELSGGRFAPGDRIHSENDAALRFGVTAVTARKAPSCCASRTVPSRSASSAAVSSAS